MLHRKRYRAGTVMRMTTVPATAARHARADLPSPGSSDETQLAPRQLARLLGPGKRLWENENA